MPKGNADATLSFAAQVAQGEEQRWGNFRISGDYLIVAAYPHMFDDKQPGRAGNWNATSSEYLLAMDRRTGAIKWTRQARYGFRHNAIAASDDRVFVMDNLSPQIVELLERRGIEPDIDPDIRALDIATGETKWRYNDEIFGTWISYSARHDVLMQAGRRGARGALSDEPHGQMVALRGTDGEKIWSRSERHTGPIVLHDHQQRVLAGQGERSVDMLTGDHHHHANPITGNPELWRFSRTYGCGTQNVSRYLITFRSGAAGYYDLYNESGVGNLAGFRAGCTNNLIAADGVLNAPDYTRSCSCSYQHQTSLAFVHMPDTEMWTYSTYGDPEPGSIRRFGVNFAAPGSRVADGGTMWINHPAAARVPTPALPMELDTTEDSKRFTNHAMEIKAENGTHRWVTASGIDGINGVLFSGMFKADEGDSTYTVRLQFAEPQAIEVGQRVFDIVIQGETVRQNLDIVKEAGGIRRGHLIEIEGVQLGEGDEISVAFRAAQGSARPPLLCGIEVFIDGDE
jgi:hypothetical protein